MSMEMKFLMMKRKIKLQNTTIKSPSLHWNLEFEDLKFPL